MITRLLDIDILFGCCLDDIELVPLERYRPVHIKTEKSSFKTTLSQWKDQVLDNIIPILKEKADTLKCKKISTSFDLCNFSYIVTKLEEIITKIPPPPIPPIGIKTLAELEETIYDIYLRRHRVRIVPTHVTDALNFLLEHGTHISRKKPRPGIDIERYCFGDWCFDTIAHTKTFYRKYPEIAFILSELDIDPQIR